MEGNKVYINKIEYLIYLPKNKEKITDIVILCVGFKVKKYSKILKIIMSNLIENNYAVVYFEYGKMYKYSHKFKENVNLEKYMDKLNIIHSFLKEQYPNYNLNVISTGLGAYITLAAIQEFDLNFERIVLDTPAINIKQLFRIKIGIYDLNDLYKINAKKQNTNDMKKIIDFFNDTIRKDLFKSRKKLNNVTIFHHINNEVVPVNDSIKYVNYFCDNSKVIVNYSLDKIGNEIVNVLNNDEER